MTAKEKYRQLCKTETSIPIFSKDWWMDAVCGTNNWDVIIVEENNRIISALPYFLKSIFGIKTIIQPMLTQTNGVWIKYPINIKNNTKLSYEKRTINQIIEKLNKLNIKIYDQFFCHTFTNWLPFYWKNFKQTTRYTYILDTNNETKNILSNFDKKLRNEIKKAQSLVQIKENCDLSTLYKLDELTFKRQHIPIPYTLNFLKNLDKYCQKGKSRKIFYAIDKQNKIHAAIYLVFDNNICYYLISGSDPEYRNSQALSLLIWHAIKFAKKKKLLFDFEGSMIESIEQFVRSFNPQQTPYFNIYKENIFFTYLKKILINNQTLGKLIRKIITK